jgi:TM2 domain-containing membrane protein YozV
MSNPAMVGVGLDPQRMLMYETQKKSVGVAYLLLIFLGWFGAHRFYLGHQGSAVALLVLTILSFIGSFILIGIFGYLIVAAWLFVDLFLTAGMVTEYNTKLLAGIAK